MTPTRVLMMVLLFVSQWLFPSTGSASEAGKAGDVSAEIRSIVEGAGDAREKGLALKRVGDGYASGDRYKEAAEAYIQSLGRYRGFTPEERLKMAVAISWGDRLDESIAELRLLLAENPEHTSARVHLARVLSWSSKLPEAIGEADIVLAKHPDNGEALLVKANALSWQGKPEEALPLYRKILEQGESFDARAGLAFAQLKTGDVDDARQSREMLKPAYRYQEDQLSSLDDALKKTFSKSLELGYSHYSDTDDNERDQYSAAFSFTLMRLRSILTYVHTEASDPSRSENSDLLFLRFTGKAAPRLTVGAGAGLFLNGQSAFPTWSASADYAFDRWSAGTTVSQDMFNETAELIQNEIRVTTVELYASREIHERFSLSGNYRYKDYSDSNSSHDLQITPVFMLYKGPPVVKAGYQLRYLDFDRQSNGGYFDPNDFIANKLFLNAGYDQEKYFGNAEVYGGHQFFKRDGEHSSDLFGGVVGSIGYRPTSNLSVRINGEFGNFDAESATGFEYWLLGGTLVYTW